MMNARPPNRQLLEKICDALTAGNSPQLPLMRAVADGRFGLNIINAPTDKWTVWIARTLPPHITLLQAANGRDDEPPPNVWACVSGLRRWAHGVLIVATERHDDYREAIRRAWGYVLALLIATTPRFAKDWEQAFRDYSDTVLFMPDPDDPVVRRQAHM